MTELEQIDKLDAQDTTPTFDDLLEDARELEPAADDLIKDGFKLLTKEGLWVKKRLIGGFRFRKRCGRCGFWMFKNQDREVEPVFSMGCSRYDKEGNPTNSCNTGHIIRTRGKF